MKKVAEKIKIVLDSDVANEIDDQFALAYAFARQDVFDIQAVTISPFRVEWKKSTSVRDGLFDSKNEAERLLRLFGVKWTSSNPFVLLGCDGFLSEGYNGKNPAVEKIVELAKKNKDLYICSFGGLTNVAMAIRLAPKIASKLHVVWLGTDNIVLDKFGDTNYCMDKKAFNEVLASDVDLTIFPTYLARAFVTSIYEFEKNISNNSVTQYLMELINKFKFNEENMGLKTIYDIGPISYLANKDKFVVKSIPAQMVAKEGKVSIDKDKKVNYIAAVPKHYFVWTDFLKAINALKVSSYKPNVFFVSDTHFNDETKIIKHHVPFESVDEMNRELVRRWNNKVGPNDIVYHLGDFGDYEFVKKLNGKITLICGTYEDADSRKKFDAFRQRLLNLGFEDVIKDGMYLDESVLGQKVYLTHRPADRKLDCKNIFGHVHTLSLVKPFGFNVCVSYHYFAPVSAETAKKYLNFVLTNLDKEND